jgi:hypothetical protein
VWSPKFLVPIIGLTLLAVALALWAYPSASDFSPSNPYWNGFQKTGAELGVAPLESPGSLLGRAKGTALIVIPYVPPSPSDLDVLKRYVDGGGVLILMDDFGYGNAVLAHLGVRARFGGDLLVDPLFNYNSLRLPRITDFTPGPFTEGVHGLVLNYATTIRDAGGLSVLALSSPVSYGDTNGNGRRETGEVGGPFPVAASASYGAGTLILVSDPSILLNSMVKLAGNRRFLQNLFRAAGEGGRAYLDVAHLPQAPLDRAKAALATARGFMAEPLVAFALAAAIAAVPLVILLKPNRR